MKNFRAVDKSHARGDEKHDINFHWPKCDHGAQLRWKGKLGANPNPPCQHSLWDKTGVH
jgi:hypothetical protein